MGGRLREAQPLTDMEAALVMVGQATGHRRISPPKSWGCPQNHHVEQFQVLPNADGRGVRTDPKQRFTAQQESDNLTHRDGDDGEESLASAPLGRPSTAPRPRRRPSPPARQEDRPIVADFSGAVGMPTGMAPMLAKKISTEVQQAGHSGVEVQGEGEQEENREGGQDVADLQQHAGNRRVRQGNHLG